MKTLVKIIFFGGLALLIAGLVAPSFIDWNEHKADVMARIAPYFKRKIETAGNVSFRMLPEPSISLGDVAVAGADGSMKNPIMTVKSVEARIKIQPLLQGRFEVEEFNLVEPVLSLDISAEGKSSLSDILADNHAGPSATAVQLNRVTISNGTLRYSSRLTGAERTFSRLNLIVAADTLLGPYKVSGDMEYQGTKVAITADTAMFNADMGAEAHISFTPEQNLPAVTANGDLSVGAGIDFMGEVKISGGTLASLVNVPSLNALHFMQQPVDLVGTAEFKSGQFSFTDINAKFGREGLHGKFSVRFPPKGLPVVSGDFDGNALTLTSVVSDRYIDAPLNYIGTVHLKGRNIVWEGRDYVAFDASLGFNGDGTWAVKSVQASLPGNAQVKLSGVVTPQSNSASYSLFHLVSEDLPKTMVVFAPEQSDIFSLLQVPGAFKNVNISGSFDVTPQKFSLYNITANLDEKYGLTGVVSIDRTSARQNAAAKLELVNWEDKTLPDALLQALSKADIDMELTARNFVKDGVSIGGLSFKGRTSAQGIEITDLSADFSGSESVKMKGRASGWAPLAGVDLSYALKAVRPDSVTRAFGIDLPPALLENVDLKGAIKGDPGKYAYTVAGTADTMIVDKLRLQNLSFTAEGGPSVLGISALTGEAWSGKLSAAASFSRSQEGGWSVSLKGDLTQADLQKIQDMLGLKGFSSGVGNIGFDLSSVDSTAAAAKGHLGLQVSNVTVKGFNTAKLAETIKPPIELPDDDSLQKILSHIFRDNGNTVFPDVKGRFLLDHGKVNIEDMMLQNSSMKLTLAGAADIAARTYSLAGDVRLAKPAYFPAVRINSGSGYDYKIDIKSIKDYIVSNLPQTKKSATETQPINGILNRLDDEPAEDSKPPHPLVPLPEYNTPMPPPVQE